MFAHVFAYDFVAVQSYLPYVVGCGVASGVLVTFLTRRRENGSAAGKVPPPDVRGSALTVDDKTFGDRRSSIRREGHPVPVQLTTTALNNTIHYGWVLDRSTGGLRISVETPIPAGTAVQVLADHAPDTTPWVTAIVRNCKTVGKRYELGCEFESTPPWNVLLLFG